MPSHKYYRLWQKITIKKCVLCTDSVPIEGISLCNNCIHMLPITLQTFMKSDIDPSLTEITAVCDYKHPISELIVAYKYRYDLTVLPILLQLFTMLPKPSSNTLLVPVPSSPSRLQERGFDHMYLLAKSLAQQWQLPVWQGVIRTGSVSQQKGLTRTERVKNMQQQFQLKNLPPVGTRLLILDDVCTTGSTIASLAQCLTQTKLTVSAYVLAHKL